MTTGDQSLIGGVVAGEYTVQSFLGGGAMGEVAYLSLTSGSPAPAEAARVRVTPIVGRERGGIAIQGTF